MAQIYIDFTIHDGDSDDLRMKKLYLGIISVGEDLYVKGAAVAEIQKEAIEANRKFAELEKTIAGMRREFAELQKRRRAAPPAKGETK